MGCRCNEAAKVAVTEERVPRFEDAFPDQANDPDSDDMDYVFRAGMQTALLWAARRSDIKGHYTHGQRFGGLIGASALRDMSTKVTEDARARAGS